MQTDTTPTPTETPAPKKLPLVEVRVSGAALGLPPGYQVYVGAVFLAVRFSAVPRAATGCHGYGLDNCIRKTGTRCDDCVSIRAARSAFVRVQPDAALVELPAGTYEVRAGADSEVARTWVVTLQKDGGSRPLSYRLVRPGDESLSADGARSEAAHRWPSDVPWQHGCPAVDAIRARRETWAEAELRVQFDVQMAELERKRAAHRAAVPLGRFGEDCAPGCPVPTEVWARTLDERGRETGFVARRAGRTLGEVARDLSEVCRRLDVGEDPLDCYTGDGVERAEARREAGGYPERSFLDEGLSVCFWSEHGGKRGPEVIWPADVLRVMCWACTGGSEGHYVHVDLLLGSYGDPKPPLLLSAFQVKTFRGFKHAWKIAEELARLLGV